MIKKVIKLVLIILWMGFIFCFSSETGEVSTRKSDGLIIKFVEMIKGRELNDSEKEDAITYLVVPVRKGAHLGIYLVLGLLVFSFVGEFISVSYKSILLSIGICFLYACSDEVHQLLVPGRSGQILDVLIDTFGSSIGILLSSFVVRKCSKNEQEKRVS